jgi:hypothetical protein
MTRNGERVKHLVGEYQTTFFVGLARLGIPVNSAKSAILSMDRLRIGGFSFLLSLLGTIDLF